MLLAATQIPVPLLIFTAESHDRGERRRGGKKTWRGQDTVKVMKRKNEPKRQKEGRETQKKSLLSTLTDYLPQYNSWRDCFCIKSKLNVKTTSRNVSEGSLVAFKATNDKQNRPKPLQREFILCEMYLLPVAMASETGSAENTMTMRDEEGILSTKQTLDRPTDENIR